MEKPRILLIDDDRGFHEHFKKAFNDFFEIKSTYTYASAETVIKGNIFFHLIILDIHLSEELPDGISLIAFIKDNVRAPIIVISKEGNDNYLRTEVKNNGVEHYLVKSDYDIPKWLELFKSKIKKIGVIKVFLSHSSKDAGFVGWLEKQLKKNGFETLLNPIDSGNYISKDIVQKIKESDYFLFINSEKSIESKWVEKEVYFAEQEEMNGDLKKIIPIKYYPCNTFLGLGPRLCLNFYENFNSFDTNLERLVRDLN